MARTIAEIYNAMATTKADMQELHDWVVDPQNPSYVMDNADQLLADLRSTSKVAIWRLFLYVFAVGSWTIETLYDKLVMTIDAIMAAKRPHTLRWYAEESKKYQYGHELVWADYQYSYAVYDPDARIIKYASAQEFNGKVILKVAKEVGGAKTALTTDEKNAFSAFWNAWRDAGTKLEIKSLAADQLRVNIRIIRDRMVLRSNNSLLRDSSVFPISDAIASFGNALEFDGILRMSKLVDAIQAAEGVVDVKLEHAWHRPAGGTYSEVDMFVNSVAGHFEIDIDASSFVYVDKTVVNVEE
jgi:hypothetical protein